MPANLLATLRAYLLIWSTAVPLALSMQSCGARDGLHGPSDAAVDGAMSFTERCDGLDNDRDLRVDETFRNDAGLYLDDAHCGACDRACPATLPFASQVACLIGPRGPRCEATACESSYARTRDGLCALAGDYLCLDCIDDSACGSFPSARCANVAGLRRCVVACDDACPDDYRCAQDDDGIPACLPPTGSCVCTADAGDFSFACATEQGGRCPGRRSCMGGELSSCQGPSERCDLEDNDCDGIVDEDFVDLFGVYSLNVHHCGQCGRDCTAESVTLLLTCGGDPLSPSCVLDCPDLHDGKQPGDTIDADGRFDNGCECTVLDLGDPISEVAGPALDENCDGADGEVLRTLYVATDGDDSHIGSPTAPLRSITEALRRSHLPLDAPRDTILVAAGTYAEAIELQEGVRIFGGYRRDFLERDINKNQVRVVAPPSSVQKFGAAAVGTNLGTATPATRLSGLLFQGRDGVEPGTPAVAILLDAPGDNLFLDDLTLVSGRPAKGRAGTAGSSGSVPIQAAGVGETPRAANEDNSHQCVSDVSNQVVGGAGGRNQCGGTDVSGGRGGDSACPVFFDRAAMGESGRGGSAASGGLGGYHVTGPISGPGCSETVCCGLADFTVPPGYEQAHPGAAGSNGVSGASGVGCHDPYGSILGASFTGGQASAGSVGQPGAGGGGGGGGGGAEIAYVDGECPFADGLGGGGGGGGAGGCGGSGGTAGQSAGPAVALLIVNANSDLPQFKQLTFVPSDGAKGGDGGDGGDGGKGGQGAAGGALSLKLRSTPTLAGPSPGERGGNGGNGGAGGGGGGGCGGASVGLWISGQPDNATLRAQLVADHSFILGLGGPGGLGGGGVVTGSAGVSGVADAVVMR